MRAFTLLEILVAMTIISLVLVAGVSMADSYVMRVKWDQLFDRLERELLDVNVYALAGFSGASGDEVLAGDSAAAVAELPEMYHLYFQKDSEQTGLWYFETQRQEGQSSSARKITYQRYLDFDVDPLRLKNMTQREGKDGQPRSSDSVILSWSHPFSQLSFHLQKAELGKQGNVLETPFILEEESLECREQPKLCNLTLTYEQPGTVLEKSLVLDLQKGMERILPVES